MSYNQKSFTGMDNIDFNLDISIGNSMAGENELFMPLFDRCFSTQEDNHEIKCQELAHKAFQVSVSKCNLVDKSAYAQYSQQQANATFAHSMSSSRSYPQDKKYVNHHYKDYSGYPVIRDGPLASTSTSPSFPVKLYHLLEDAENEGFTNIISWQPHGRAFRVHHPQKFAAEIMPNYFGKIRFASFLRQVNLYGFLRLYQKTNDQNAYYQELFLRNRFDLVKQIRRECIKGHGVRQSACPEREPDLYALPPVSMSALGLSCTDQRSASEGALLEASRRGRQHNKHQHSMPMMLATSAEPRRDGNASALRNASFKMLPIINVEEIGASQSFETLGSQRKLQWDLEPLPLSHPDTVPLNELQRFLSSFMFEESCVQAICKTQNEANYAISRPTALPTFNSRAA